MRMKQRLLLSTSHFSRIPLSPNAHEKRLELNFVELLECGLGVALVGSEHCHDVFTSEIAFSTKLVILSRDIDSTIQINSSPMLAHLPWSVFAPRIPLLPPKCCLCVYVVLLWPRVGKGCQWYFLRLHGRR